MIHSQEDTEIIMDKGKHELALLSNLISYVTRKENWF